MGFKLERKHYKLVFDEDHELHGAEIVVRSSTLGEQRIFVEKFPESTSPFETLEYETTEFLKRVVSWNLEDADGNPLPREYSAYEAAVDVSHIRAINTAWRDAALAKPPADLKKESSGTETTDPTPSIEESLPMESL